MQLYYRGIFTRVSFLIISPLAALTNPEHPSTELHGFESH